MNYELMVLFGALEGCKEGEEEEQEQEEERHRDETKGKMVSLRQSSLLLNTDDPSTVHTKIYKSKCES